MMTSAQPVYLDDRALYRPSEDPVLVEVPGFDFAMVDGAGDPDTSPDFQQALAALYAYSYPVVIAMRRAGLGDQRIRPLEGLWWTDDATGVDFTGDRTTWRWTLMVRQPQDVPAEIAAKAMTRVVAKVGPVAAAGLRTERFVEGRCAQLLHLGPYADEHATIERLHAFIAHNGLRPTGRHHEIYLTDPHRTVPEAMRTVLRQPVTG
jgi:hypothetical protein